MFLACCLAALIAFAPPSPAAAPPVPLAPAPLPPLPPLPEPRQLAWHEQPYYAFVHFGPNTFSGNEWGHGTEDPRSFNPTALDCRQWCRVFKDAGMTGVIITAKHHDGFCLWPSATTAHTVARSPWRDGQGDVLRELSDACRELGLRFGVYLSPWDRNHPQYGSGEAYNEVYRAQLREVLTRYGEVFEVWFDGACGEGPNGKRQVYDFPSFERTVRELMPNAVMFSDVGPDVRWVGNEQGHAGATNWCMLDVKEHGRGADRPPSTTSLHEGDRDGDRWIPAECDVSIRPGWFWRASENEKVKSAAALFDLYERSVGHNASFLLNVPVDSRGLIHESDAAGLLELKGMIDATYGVDLAAGRPATASAQRGGAGSPFAPSCITSEDRSDFWSVDDDVRSATIEVRLADARSQPVEFDRVLLEEPIALGQRIEKFRIEAHVLGDGVGDGAGWREIGRGTTIGNNRIVRVPRTMTDAMRVVIESSRACPALKRVGVHRTK